MTNMGSGEMIRPSQLWHMMPSELEALRPLAAGQIGREQILAAVEEFASQAHPSGVADLDDLYATGIQLASIWPDNAQADGVTPYRFGPMAGGIALACGMLRYEFDQVFSLMPRRERRRFELAEKFRDTSPSAQSAPQESAVIPEDILRSVAGGTPEADAIHNLAARPKYRSST